MTTKGIFIRPAIQDDAASIASVQVRSWRETYVGLLPDALLRLPSIERRTEWWQQILDAPARVPPLTACVAVHKDGEVAGFCSCSRRSEIGEMDRDDDCGEIRQLYVVASCQRQGIGTRLMGTMARALRDQDCRSMALWVLRDNHKVRCFYAALGGKVISARDESIAPRLVLRKLAYGWIDLSVLAARTPSALEARSRQT